MIRLSELRESTPWLGLDALRALKEGPDAIEARQRRRLADLVTFARANSPYYRLLYRSLSQDVDDVAYLPVTDKKSLMACYDDWATDRDVTLDHVQEIADNAERTGDYFLGKYTVRATSGTTGFRGIFVTDSRSESVGKALALRAASAWLGAGDLLRIAARGGRMGFVVHGSGHGVASVVATRLRKGRFGRRQFAMFSLQSSLERTVSQLNRFRPAILLSYATEATLLADEQEEGRLEIAPLLVILTGEGLSTKENGRVREAFHTRVVSTYASNECSFMTHSCPAGWLHVNSDWVVAEPVDQNYRAVPPGVESHTLLISNLANRVQPVLRYDIGDRAVLRPDPCTCGSPLPAIRINGRTTEVLYIPTAHGQLRAIPPGAFGDLNHVPGLDTFQIAQTAPTTLRFRFRTRADADPEQVWRSAEDLSRRILVEHKIENVTFQRADEPPALTPGGKLPRIIAGRE